MVLKRNVFTRGIVLAFCLFLAVLPFFQPKKVQASPLLLGITALLTTGMIAGRYVQTNVLYTPEQINQINEKWTENLQAAFPDPVDYNHQMNILQNLNQKLLNGEDVDLSKYSGKALYSVLKGVVDVIWPESYPESTDPDVAFLAGFGDVYVVFTNSHPEEKVPLSGYNAKKAMPSQPHDIFFTDASVIASDNWGNFEYTSFILHVFQSSSQGPRLLGKVWIYRDQRKLPSGYHVPITRPGSGASGQDFNFYAAAALGIPEYTIKNTVSVPNITAKTANKVKLPTRLPQTVINNITNYIDGSTENLIVNPTADELLQLPDNYNPTTDELPDLPGYVDVTPDQEPSIDPEPTPTPPDPTPTPPEYNGDEWVNPIGSFFDGLLKFMKAAFVPTLSLNLDALNTVPDNLGSKFPFCLPGDIVNVLTMFVAEPQPPPVKLMLPFSVLGGQDQEFEADISVIDDKMETIRTLIFLMFLVGLAWFLFDHYMGGDS